MGRIERMMDNKLENLLSEIEKLKIIIKSSNFDLSELEILRREVERLGNVIYEKIVDVQVQQKKKNPNDFTIYICNLCGAEFLSKQSINSHIVRRHHLRPSEDYVTRRQV